MVDQAEVETKALTVVEQAKAVIVTDNASYVEAGGFFKNIDTMIKEVKSTFDPICEAANKAHKQATSKRAGFLDPLMSAKKSVKMIMSDWDAKQEKIRKEEERRLAAIAQQEEEDRRLQEAIEAEGNGDHEEAEAIMEEKIYVPPVVVKKSVPKMKGGPVYREVWKVRVVAARKVPREYMIPDEKKLGQMARALKAQFNVSGVEAYSERV